MLFANGLVLDGLGDVAVEGWVHVEGERIVATGRGQPRPHLAQRTVDLAGRTIMPGLIDTHVHLAGGDYFPGYEHEAIGIAALRTAEAARRTLLAGFTTVRTAASRDFLDLDIRDAIRLGLAPGPRIIGSGRGITCTGGHLHEVAIEADGPDEIRKAVRQHVKRGVDSLKIMMSGGVATAGLPVEAEQFSVEEVRTAVYEAHRVGMKVLTHSIGLQAIRNAIEGGVDSIDHGQYLDEECAVRMRERGIYLVPTFGPFYYYTEMRKAEDWRIQRAEGIKDQHQRAFRLALDAGVSVAMGSDCGAPSRFPNGENALELTLMVRHGMPPSHAVRCATSEAARLAGVLDQVGSLESGKLADLIVVDGNPLEDISVLQHKIQLVMKGGTLYRDDLV
ncbi:MAG: amidohydrolase family protein [Chloroflexi bacterium]|nr:amidohydrolase family protein [Chloroflexota bacterium]